MLLVFMLNMKSKNFQRPEINFLQRIFGYFSYKTFSECRMLPPKAGNDLSETEYLNFSRMRACLQCHADTVGKYIHPNFFTVNTICYLGSTDTMYTCNLYLNAMLYMVTPCDVKLTIMIIAQNILNSYTKICNHIYIINTNR